MEATAVVIFIFYALFVCVWDWLGIPSPPSVCLLCHSDLSFARLVFVAVCKLFCVYVDPFAVSLLS